MGPRPFLLIAALAVALISPAQAARNVPVFDLAFTPTENIGMVGPALAPELAAREVKVQVVDGRQAADASVIGSRSDDDDRKHILKAGNAVVPWAEQVVAKLAAAWGLKVSPAATSVLEIKLLLLEIVETNQAVGASFESSVRLAGELRDPSGKTIWSANSGGGSTRYGKKFSNDNCNEVLSDGLVQAVSILLGSVGSTAPDPTDAVVVAPAPGPAVTPGELLAELQKLRQEGFDDATLLAVVKKKTLAVPLGTEDMVAWKRAGLSEEVIRAAVELPVK